MTSLILAAARTPGPGANLLQAHRRARERDLTQLAGQIEAMQAQIVGAPLEQRDVQRARERPLHHRDIALKELVLQGLGAGRDDDLAGALEDGGEIGEGLAGASACLGDQQPRHQAFRPRRRPSPAAAPAARNAGCCARTDRRARAVRGTDQQIRHGPRDEWRWPDCPTPRPRPCQHAFPDEAAEVPEAGDRHRAALAAPALGTVEVIQDGRALRLIDLERLKILIHQDRRDRCHS